MEIKVTAPFRVRRVRTTGYDVNRLLHVFYEQSAKRQRESEPLLIPEVVSSIIEGFSDTNTPPADEMSIYKFHSFF
jgi:hypothetical protein